MSKKPMEEWTDRDWERMGATPPAKPVLTLTLDRDQVEALDYCLGVGSSALDDGFPEPRDANRRVIASIQAMLDPVRER